MVRGHIKSAIGTEGFDLALTDETVKVHMFGQTYCNMNVGAEVILGIQKWGNECKVAERSLIRNV